MSKVLELLRKILRAIPVAIDAIKKLVGIFKPKEKCGCDKENCECTKDKCDC